MAGSTNYKEEDKEIKEAYEDFERRREEETRTSGKSIIQSLPSKFWLAIAGIIGFMMYLTFVRQSMQQSTFYWFLVGLGILVIILSVQKESEKKQLIPEGQLKAILKEKLKEKQRISPSEVPVGDIQILLPCKLKKIEGYPTKYVLSFKIITPSNYERYYTAEMNPYDGYLMGFEERIDGFRGIEVTDVSFIRRREDIWEDKYFRKGRKPQ